MDKTAFIIVDEIKNVLNNKRIKDIINLETDNIYNKSGVSKIVKNYIQKNCFYDLDTIDFNNIKIKIIPVNESYKCHEAMSFSSTSLYNILFENWDSEDEFEVATLKKQLNNKFLLIPIIKIKQNGIYNNFREWEIGNFSYWVPSNEDLSKIGNEWKLVQNILKEGVKIRKVKFGKSYRNTNNLPKQSETDFIHLRPHGKNSFDYDIPYLNYTKGLVEITKQSFWLNKAYINLLLEKHKWKMNLKEE